VQVVPQLIVSTLLLGAIYALIAVGLTLIFGVMRVVNFAHGEFLMLGMYLGFWAFALLGLDPYLTLVLSLPLCFAVGWASYRAVMGPIVHASHNVQVFTTVGLSIALQNLALVLWTADARFLRTDYYAVVIRIGGAAFNVAQIVAFAIAVGLTAGLFAFMRWSYTGKVMRATAQDRQASALMGIDTDRVYAVTWAVGIACVGAAGVLLAPIYPVYPKDLVMFVVLS
jgi:branched-chain amino acid transport system permease protein